MRMFELFVVNGWVGKEGVRRNERRRGGESKVGFDERGRNDEHLLCDNSETFAFLHALII